MANIGKIDKIFTLNTKNFTMSWIWFYHYFIFYSFFAVAATMLSDMEEMPTVLLGDYVLQMELEELKPEVQEIARRELRETPDVKREAIKELRELLKG